MHKFISILGLLLITIFVCKFGAQNIYAQNVADQGKASLWKGFDRFDFKFEGRDARIIAPSQALPGSPWVWRARFPDWHTEADSLLVSEGFHLVYINTDGKFGSPDAVRIWNKFYDHLTQRYKLQKKVALAGVSRGGLFVYNWAAKNPSNVSCIYAEAPVCDFKSWPAGFGASPGSQVDWERLKKEYGFISDEDANLYALNPVDQLAALAKAKIPILHMIALNDKIVPPEENTFPLINKYIRMGGVATVNPCTQGVQNLQGHHFEIETPRVVADFIKYHSINYPLDARDYHEIGSGLQNCYIQFDRKKHGRVAFLGGSITYNPGWRDSVSNFLIKRFPETEFEFIEAGIPSMGTTPAAFRLERDVLLHGKVDLLFEEAAVNDATNGRTRDEQIRAMEGIIRRLRKYNPAIDIVMMHFVDPDKMKSYRSGQEPDVIKNHNQVAAHYNIPTINLAKEVTDRIDHGEFTWEEDFINLHPSPFGQGVYARSIIKFLNDAFNVSTRANDSITSHRLPERLDEFCFDEGSLIDISSAKYSENWYVEASWNPDDGTGVRPNYVNVPMLVGDRPAGWLKFKFRGNAVGIAVAAGQDAGMIEYRIDQGDWSTLDLFTRWSEHLHLPWYYTLASGLMPSDHELEIKIASNKNEKSNGHACRIRYFYVN